MAKMLIVIDMQNDFIDGALGTPEAVKIVPRVKAKIKEYEKNGDKIFFTKDTHTEDYLSTQEGKKLPIPHCIEGTHGWEITDGLNTSNHHVVIKRSFGYADWFYYSFGEVYDEIEVIGLCTDICVISNVLILKALFPEVPIKVDASCCAGTTPEAHEAALTVMRSCQIEVV